MRFVIIFSMSHASNFSATDFAEVAPAFPPVAKSGAGRQLPYLPYPRQKLCLGMEDLWEGKEKVVRLFHAKEATKRKCTDFLKHVLRVLY